MLQAYDMFDSKNRTVQDPDSLLSADSRKVGSMKGHKFIADGHEIDDYDDEIAQLFGSGPDDIPS